MCFISTETGDVMRVFVTGYPPASIADSGGIRSGPSNGSGKELAIRAARSWINWRQSATSDEFEVDERVVVGEYDPAIPLH
jgi:hypothetical protein